MSKQRESEQQSSSSKHGKGKKVKLDCSFLKAHGHLNGILLNHFPIMVQHKKIKNKKIFL